jgi:hypothetical protein
MVKYVHAGYSSIFEGNLFLIFEDGILVKEYTKMLSQKEIEVLKKEDNDSLYSG